MRGLAQLGVVRSPWRWTNDGHWLNFDYDYGGENLRSRNFCLGHQNSNEELSGVYSSRTSTSKCGSWELLARRSCRCRSLGLLAGSHVTVHEVQVFVVVPVVPVFATPPGGDDVIHPEDVSSAVISDLQCGQVLEFVTHLLMHS